MQDVQGFPVEVLMVGCSYRSIVLMTSLLHRKCSPVDAWLFTEISSSEYLVENKYAAADKITMDGGSNGGASIRSTFVWCFDPLQTDILAQVFS